MQNIAVVFGGRTVEHDISIITGLGIIKNISSKFNVIPIYITRSGEWITGEHLGNTECYNTEPKGKICGLVMNEPWLEIKGWKKRKIFIDCAVLALHGGEYEGGAVAGVFSLSHIPTTSAGVLGSSLCMDKVATKRILESLKIETPNYVWGTDCAEIVKNVENNELNYPLIVKPARAGSSIGITKIQDNKSLKKAIEYAQNFDKKVIIEQCIMDFRELNISAIKIKDEIKCSSVEEVATTGLFGFEQKYMNDKNTKRKVPADLPKWVVEKVEEIAKKVYAEFDLAGVVRIDFLFADDMVYLNEINTIPGSFAFYLWRDKGVSFGKLISLAINEAIEQNLAQKNITYEYNSNVLADLGSIDKIVEK